jgi:Squalene-hopene cyclase C-terminal domain/Prenyltransferase and squalene oxidase repeat
MAWRSNAERRGRARRRELGLALGTALAAIAGICGPAAAAPPPGPRLDAMVRYLQSQQGRDGGFPASPGGIEAPDFTAWAALALAAAGINPQEQSPPEGQSAFAYLLAHAGSLSSTTDFERELLVVDAAGTDPHDFAGRDLVGAILARQITAGPEDGAFEHEAANPEARVNDTVFAILALSPIHEEAVSRAVTTAREWLVRVQNAGEPQQGGGSWPSVSPDTVTGEPEHNVEMTGAAIQALAAAGDGGSVARERALAFLRQAQEPDGGFPERPGEAEANVASTAWAVQGIWAAGEDPATWLREGNQPLRYMESMQHEDGSLQYDAGSYENPVWITSYAGLAFAGAYFPLAAVAPAQHTPASSSGEPSSSSETSTPPAPEAGHGGVAGQQARGGVIVGGGGDGAAAFSRPQPQSKGHTPGGARQLTGASAGADRKGGGKERPPAAGTQTVKGVLLSFRGPQAGAPGLHSAAAGGSASSWLAIAIGLGAVGLALLGARLERRRPRILL